MRVERALAGDRLALEGGREVRLAGIEAPAPGQPWAEAARAGLERLAAGRRADLLYGGRADDGEGHGLAHVRIADGAWLQAALLDHGLARVRPRPDEAALASEMLAHEARARKRRRGVWSDAAYAVRLPDEFGWEVRGLQIVEGRVRRVTRRGEVIYLDFADDWRGRVSAEIPTRSLAVWRAAGLEPETLRGRLIRVRGDAKGFHLKVETPESVEVLREK